VDLIYFVSVVVIYKLVFLPPKEYGDSEPQLWNWTGGAGNVV
jgi:hypothetical protein